MPSCCVLDELERRFLLRACLLLTVHVPCCKLRQYVRDDSTANQGTLPAAYVCMWVVMVLRLAAQLCIMAAAFKVTKINS